MNSGRVYFIGSGCVVSLSNGKQSASKYNPSTSQEGAPKNVRGQAKGHGDSGEQFNNPTWLAVCLCVWLWLWLRGFVFLLVHGTSWYVPLPRSRIGTTQHLSTRFLDGADVKDAASTI